MGFGIRFIMSRVVIVFGLLGLGLVIYVSVFWIFVGVFRFLFSVSLFIFYVRFRLVYRFFVLGLGLYSFVVA